jgi:geranylgeranyl diphosphate synthase, type II
MEAERESSERPSLPDKPITVLDLTRYMVERRALVEAALLRRLPPETERPVVLHRAMRYAICSGGKRVRPILCLAAAEVVGGRADAALLPAVAIECLHTYTLIHDDLPSMDNDDLRRGQPTLHKVFGEANAILAGDSLLALAFELLAQARVPDRLVLELAQAVGSRGMAGGQFEDLASEGQMPNAEQLEFIYGRKTATLIRAACRMGGLVGGADEAEMEVLSRYGERLGLAFQIADDTLNATSTSETLGKAAGSDLARGKMTGPALWGIEGARRRAASLAEDAIAALAALPLPSEPLAAVARFVVNREA